MVYPQDPEEEDPSGKGSHSHMGTRAPCADWFDRGIRRCTQSSNSQADLMQRQEKLFEELDLSGMETWPPKMAASTKFLLAKYHEVFSLEPRELGCTLST